MTQTLQEIARAMVAPGKGILAADESTGTIKKRFDSIGVESTEQTRRDYRELLFTTPDIGEFISGVIMFDETIRQTSAAGTSFNQVLQDVGVIPGIKVDVGAKDLAGSMEEKITEGLDGLRDRLKEYFELGARFAKWRAVIEINEEKSYPSDYCIHVNAHALGRYAALSQEAGIVPIVEPEVLMDGSHSIDVCYDVTKRTLQAVFDELEKQHVKLDGMILKPNMVIDGSEFEPKSSPLKIAEMTVKCFEEVVSREVPGIVFLSGGQTEPEACVNLNAMNKGGQSHPWELSFSYGRALQQSALQAWGGKEEKKQAAQEAFVHRAKLAVAARSGTYSPEMEI